MAARGMTVGEVGGLPLLHVDRPGRTRAALHIGVGWADETFATRGVSHVVEHLVMHAVTRGRFEMNASVGMHRTDFWAAGRPEQVQRFLDEVAAGIREIRLDRLEHESKVLQAEGGGEGFGPHDAMLKCRFGHRGPGLAMFWGTGALAADPDVVTQHVRTWFRRGNAVLTVSGPMPDGLAVELPDGAVPARSFPEVGRPGVVRIDGVQDPVLSFVVPDSPAVTALTGTMATRLEEDLRHGQGQVYGIVPLLIRLPGTGTVVVQIGAQTTPEAATSVAEALAAELRHRVEVGMAPEERDEMLEWWDGADAEESDLEDLEVNAERLLCGLPVQTHVEAKAALEALTAADVAELARAGAPGARLLVPYETTPTTHLPEGRICPMAQRMTTTPLRRRVLSRAPKGVALGFADGLVELRDEDGDVHAFRLEDVVAVGVHRKVRVLMSGDGCSVVVDPRDFAGADAVVRAVDDRVPVGRRFDLEGM